MTYRCHVLFDRMILFKIIPVGYNGKWKHNRRKTKEDRKNKKLEVISPMIRNDRFKRTDSRRKKPK